MVKSTYALAAAGALCAMSPALAQGTGALPDRPIARAEVAAAVKQQFAAMDTNHDGSISPAEFEAYREKQNDGRLGDLPPVLRAFGHVGSHWFEKTDADGNGRVTPAEAAARPLQMFDMADTNGDGTVSVEEQKLATMLMGLRGK